MRLQRKTIVIALAGAATATALAMGATAAVAATSPTPTARWANGQHMTGMGAGMGAGMGMGYDGAGSMHADIAAYLGLTEQELTDRMTTGSTLADIAKAQGKTLGGLTQVMVKEMSERLDAVPGLTAQQKAQRLAWMRANLQRMLTTAHTPGSHMTGPGGMGMGMGGGMGSAMGAGTWS